MLISRMEMCAFMRTRRHWTSCGHGSTALISSCKTLRRGSRQASLKRILIGRANPGRLHDSLGQRLLPATGNGREPDNLSRDHDELRHSMRSVLAHFRSHAGNFHLLASDFRIPQIENVTQEGPVYRLGQVPQWLDVEQSPRSWSDDRVILTITHHANFIRPYNDTVFNRSVFWHVLK